MPENDAFHIASCDRHVYLKFSAPRPTLSSAILNGGESLADYALIMQVRENFYGKHRNFDDPVITLDQYCREIGLEGTTVGMMTSAPMSSFRTATRREGGLIATACLTAGLSNARCAGDRADRQEQETPGDPGTINIVLITNAKMALGTMAEAFMIVTEAKVAALRALNKRSPVSGDLITGTGTDVVVVVSGHGPPAAYCGKHTLLGEMIASAVIQSLHESLLD